MQLEVGQVPTLAPLEMAFPEGVLFKTSLESGVCNPLPEIIPLLENVPVTAMELQVLVFTP
jgi:hypothetical protein